MPSLSSVLAPTPAALLGVAATLALAPAAPAPAQFGLEGGYQDAFRPAFGSRDVQMAVDALKLDEGQRFILETLFEDYNSDFQAGVDGFRQSIADLQNQLPAGAGPEGVDVNLVMRVVFGSMEKWRLDSRVLADQFLVDIRDLLNDEQLAMWPSFDRRLFRTRHLSNGRLGGENIDLLSMVDDMDLEPSVRGPIQSILDEYEVRLDEALRKREGYVQEAQPRLIEAVQDPNSKIPVDIAERQAALRVAVRDVNEQYAAAIAAGLPPETGATMLQTFRERMHPKIFRKTEVQQLFEAARKIEELSDETRTAIVALEGQYLVELAGFNERLLQSVHEFQPREFVQKALDAQQRLQGGTPQRPEDPLRDELAKRREMGTKYVEQLKALLTPEQFAALPGARRWAIPQEQGTISFGDVEGAPKFTGRANPDGTRSQRLVNPSPASGEPSPSGEEPAKKADEEGDPDG